MQRKEKENKEIIAKIQSHYTDMIATKQAQWKKETTCFMESYTPKKSKHDWIISYLETTFSPLRKQKVVVKVWTNP
mgnify:FL=1